MNRTVSRSLERLEARAAASAPKSFSCRIHLVHREKGLTGVIVLESGKPNMHVLPTPEDEEWFRTDLERHRALSKKPTDICP
jgi:hypothetical protein